MSVGYELRENQDENPTISVSDQEPPPNYPPLENGEVCEDLVQKYSLPGSCPPPSYIELFPAQDSHSVPQTPQPQDVNPQDVNPQDTLSHPTQPHQPSPQTSNAQTPQVVVQQPAPPPFNWRAHNNYRDAAEEESKWSCTFTTVFIFSLSSLIFTILCFWPGLICSLPSVVYVCKSRGDYDKYFNYSLMLAILAIIFFGPFFLVVCIILGIIFG